MPGLQACLAYSRVRQYHQSLLKFSIAVLNENKSAHSCTKRHDLLFVFPLLFWLSNHHLIFYVLHLLFLFSHLFDELLQPVSHCWPCRWLFLAVVTFSYGNYVRGAFLCFFKFSYTQSTKFDALVSFFCLFWWHPSVNSVQYNYFSNLQLSVFWVFLLPTSITSWHKSHNLKLKGPYMAVNEKTVVGCHLPVNVR